MSYVIGFLIGVLVCLISEYLRSQLHAAYHIAKVEHCWFVRHRRRFIGLDGKRYLYPSPSVRFTTLDDAIFLIKLVAPARSQIIIHDEN